jgi:ribosome-binding factor A
MSQYRQSRLASVLTKHITDILQFELKDPHVGFLTVTHVDVNHDLSFLKVYVSFMGVKDSLVRLEAIRRAKGFVRSALAKKVDMYKVPDLQFYLDDAYEHAKKIEETLANAMKKTKKEDLD